MSKAETETEVIPTAMVLADDSASLADLADLGFITPIATPARLRAAFAEKQRLYAAILDESDYIYTVAYTESNRTKQNIYSRREDAEKAAKAYGVDIRASPKKSGIVKLASALGIEARRKMTRGLPDQADAAYSYVVYEATHKRTGRSEEGIGWCDKTERGGRIGAHDVIATADTRAYNRAILRLAGFGDVSADEIVAGASLDDGPVQAQAEPAPKKPQALPASTTDEVITAQRWWAEESAKREAGFLPEAQQNSKAGRELRARARRGNETAARQMGNLGYTWHGTAQDSISHETFEVEEPTVTVAAIEAVKKAIGDPAKPGWDLSGTGSAYEEDRKNDPKPVSREQAAASVPAAGVPRSMSSRDGNSETITTIQAKNLSELLLSKLGTKEAAQAWLKKHADVERSSLVRQNQYDALKTLLTKED